MKLTRILLIIFVANIFISAPAFCEKQETQEWINNNKISIGETFYFLSNDWGWDYWFKYLGIENNAIKVEVGRGGEAGDSLLTVPLNSNRQAIVRNSEYLKNLGFNKNSELLITVLDDFGRIKVEKIAEKQSDKPAADQ